MQLVFGFWMHTFRVSWELYRFEDIGQSFARVSELIDEVLCYFAELFDGAWVTFVQGILLDLRLQALSHEANILFEWVFQM